MLQLPQATTGPRHQLGTTRGSCCAIDPMRTVKCESQNDRDPYRSFLELILKLMLVLTRLSSWLLELTKRKVGLNNASRSKFNSIQTQKISPTALREEVATKGIKRSRRI
jgi:hypothetical protein